MKFVRILLAGVCKEQSGGEGAVGRRGGWKRGGFGDSGFLMPSSSNLNSEEPK